MVDRALVGRLLLPQLVGEVNRLRLHGSDAPHRFLMAYAEKGFTIAQDSHSSSCLTGLSSSSCPAAANLDMGNSQLSISGSNSNTLLLNNEARVRNFTMPQDSPSNALT
eukprot:756670-Hanusia_phi.AAC.9